MKSLVKFFTSLVFILLLLQSGCDLVNQGNDPPKPSSGGDLVINEVFTLSPDRYYAYSWIEILNPTSNSIQLQKVTNPASGFVVGADGTIIKTDDDGETWRSVDNSTTDKFNAISFSQYDTAYLAGDNGVIKKLRVDSAGTYSLVTLTPPKIVNYNDVYAAPSPGRLVLAVGDGGTVIQSADRGYSWGGSAVPTNTTKNLHGMAYLGQNDIYAVGDGGTILKGRVNRVWAAQTPPFIQSTVNFYAIGFYSPGGRGYVLGENGAIAKTTNGGTIWKPDSSGVTSTLRSIFIPPVGFTQYRQNRVWVVGDNGTILRTNDSIWTKQESGTTASLYNVKFVDSVRGWAVGEGGLILGTTNGGETWVSQNTGTSSKLLSIAFLDLQFDLYNFYALELYAIKYHIFFDPNTFTINENVILKVDTGIVQLSSVNQLSFNFNGQQVGTGDASPSIPPGGYFVLNNDSAKFKDHTNLGPGRVQVQNIGISVQSATIDSLSFPPRIVALDLYKWKLPISGEMRLYKAFARFTRGRNARFLDGFVKCVDVVRWGGFKATNGEFNVPGLLDNNSYDQNEPVGLIPEFSSLSRYFNDVNVDVTRSSTNSSFYFTDLAHGENPLPGWASQRGK